MIVLDASVLIAHFESADTHHEAASDLLIAHASESFASSVVTLAEVYVGAARAGRADQLDQLLSRLAVEPLDLPAAGARRLGELRATTRLKMPDCCVLFTAATPQRGSRHFRQETGCRCGRSRIVSCARYIETALRAEKYE